MKIKLTKGLSLNKEAITKLQESQMGYFKGGNVPVDASCADLSCVASCKEDSCRK
ncbi:class I lanthipeptide [Flavobacterium sp. ZS1P70]|uniref:Class I lanthipeptide n=1 Tax=Flavobacterium zhoui TaxID=3230414 RepID=A0ABW6I7B3_9FLAO